MKRTAPILMLLFAFTLTGCDRQNSGKEGASSARSDDATEAEIARYSAQQAAASAITAVDAAIGDAAAMPADWSGPTAYDLRNTSTNEQALKAEDAMPRLAERPVAGDFQTVAEDFPSVVESRAVQVIPMTAPASLPNNADKPLPK